MNKSEEPDRGAIVTRAEYEWSTTAPSTAVVETVAGVVSDGPTSFGPLYDRIDPDALDAIFRAGGAGPPADGTRVSFPLADRVVVVHGDGGVVVREATGQDAGN